MPKFVTFKNLEQYNDKIYPKIKNLETDVGQVVDPATHMPIEATKTSAGVVQLATAQDITNGTANKVVDAKELADAIIRFTSGEAVLEVSGLEVGDIGLAPLGIDETDNCRRYLNGQVILQSQFEAFTEKLKHAITLYPNLVTTEQNWQSAVTLSPLGQCGKFVIDDEAGTIRLPKVVNVMGALDLSSIGELQSAGLPNITGSIRDVSHTSNPNSVGALSYNKEAELAVAQGDSYTYLPMQLFFNASNSNSIYGNSTTVQQEAIKYPYFIQVALSSNVDVQIGTQVRLNNPFSLFMPYWSPIELNNLSWLRSNKQWNNGSVYTSAYEFLLSKYNSGTEQTETIAGVSVTYKLADNGMKIITDKSKYDALISASGSAWFFVLDTENTQFILPYTNGFMQFGNEPGKFTEAGLPNIIGHFANDLKGAGGWWSVFTAVGCFATEKRDGYSVTNINRIGGSGDTNQNSAVTLDASLSNPIYGKSDTVQPNSITGYLYFYVGEVEQDANIIATSGLAESVSRKLDIEGASSVGMPSERYVNLSVGVTGTTYTAPADGWFFVIGSGTDIIGHVTLETLNNNLIAQATTTNAGWSIPCLMPVRKGDIIQLRYNSVITIRQFRFIYAEGAK